MITKETIMKTKTIKELAESVDKALKDHDFTNSKSDSALVMVCSDEDILTKIVGHHHVVATSIASAMVDDDEFRAVMIAALAYHRQIMQELMEKTGMKDDPVNTNPKFS